LADKFYWAVAPRVFGKGDAVPVLAKIAIGEHVPLAFDSVRRFGDDVLIEGQFVRV
jgi:riboflavin biosynthesis pyrimidine reductase